MTRGLCCVMGCPHEATLEVVDGSRDALGHPDPDVHGQCVAAPRARSKLRKHEYDIVVRFIAYHVTRLAKALRAALASSIIQAMYMSMSERLRLARKRADFTQEALARRIGVSVRSLQLYEHGDVEPRVTIVQRWASECGVPVVDLLDPAAA